MTQAAYINAISYYLPEANLSNEVLNLKFPDWSVDKIASKTGIFSRKIAGENEFASDLAVKAANLLFEEYAIAPESIDFLIYCTQSPDYFLPTTACILQHKLGLSTSAGAFDFNLGCSGYVYGLGIAKSLVVSGVAKKILLITAETYSKFIHPHDKSNLTIFGDAAAATLVSNQEGPLSIGEFIFGTDGSGAENLIVKNGGIKNLHKKGEDIYNDHLFVRNDDNLYMNGSEIFNFTTKAVPNLVQKVIEKNQTHLDAIDMFIFHQANKYMLDFIRKKIGIPSEKFFIHLQDCGNTVSSTIPIAIKEYQKDTDINKQKVLLAGFGVGYSWAGCVLN